MHVLLTEANIFGLMKYMKVLCQRHAVATFALPVLVRLRIENPRQKRRKFSNEFLLSNSVLDNTGENYVCNIW